VFVYLLRSIKARWLENLAIISVFAVVVATSTLIVTFAANMRQTAVSGADPSTVVVMTKGAASMEGSRVGKEGLDIVRVMPQVEQRGGVALAAPGIISRTQLRTSDGVSLFVVVRGVDLVAYQVHNVKVIKGRLPNPGTDEVMIGKKMDGRFPDLTVGGRFNKHPVVGVFDNNGGLLEQEIWVDRQRLAAELGRKVGEPVQFVMVKTKSPADAEAFVTEVEKSKSPAMSAMTEPKYMDLAGGQDARELMRLAIAFSLLLAFGAGIASVNTLYSSLLGRMSEFAMLHAIGVRRRRLAGLILQESVLLAAIGITIGVAIAVALNGQEISRLWTDHPFEQIPLRVGLASILPGVAIGLTVGIVGGSLPGVSIFRMDVRANLG
jgi:putative ABC transport system permease protein